MSITIIITTTFSHSCLRTFILLWCLVCSSFGFIVSLASTGVIYIIPSAVPLMAERKLFERLRRHSSITSISTIESTTSTLVNESSVSSLEGNKTRKARRLSISETIFHNSIVLHRPKIIVRPLRPICHRLTLTMQESVITPASKFSSQIIPSTKSSTHHSLIKVAKLTRKGIKASKKLARNL